MKKLTKVMSVLLAAIMVMTALCVSAGAETPSASKLGKLADSTDSNTYWVVFKEGSRNNRIEMSTFSAKKNYRVILWDKYFYCDKMIGKANQYYYNESTDSFKYLTDWEHLSDNCMGIVASNVDVYNLDGDIIFKKTYTQTKKTETPSASSLQIELKKGSSVKLACILTDSKEGKAEWTTSKKSVATVSSSGKVTGKGKGTAAITAEYGDKKLKILVKVTS